LADFLQKGSEAFEKEYPNLDWWGFLVKFFDKKVNFLVTFWFKK